MRRIGGRMSAIAATAIVLVAGAGGSSAHADPDRGRFLELRSVPGPAAVSDLAPGDTVAWQLRLTSTADPVAEVAVALDAWGPLIDTVDLVVDLDTCTVRWRGSFCDGGATRWLADGSARALRASSPLARIAVDEPVWLQVRLTLPIDTGSDAQALASTVQVRALASGAEPESAPSPRDSVPAPRSAPRPPDLAWTGVELMLQLALAIAAVGTGLALTAAARRRRDQEVDR